MHPGHTLVVTKLDRLARSLPDARAIADELTARQVRLSIGSSVYDPTDPVGRLLFNVLAMVAEFEFESDLIRLRTREGMKVAKAKGHLRGRKPALHRSASRRPKPGARRGRAKIRGSGSAGCPLRSGWAGLGEDAGCSSRSDTENPVVRVSL